MNTTIRQKLQPLYEVIDDECTALTEEYFRAQSCIHRRLNRRRKPQITQAQLDELNQLQEKEVELRKEWKPENPEDKFQELLTTVQRIDRHLGNKNGLFSERDLKNLQAAEARRRKQRARQQELRRRGAYRDGRVQ